MAQEESKYIISSIFETKNYEKAKAQLEAYNKLLAKTQAAATTPGFLRSAEQNVLLANRPGISGGISQAAAIGRISSITPSQYSTKQLQNMPGGIGIMQNLTGTYPTESVQSAQILKNIQPKTPSISQFGGLFGIESPIKDASKAFNTLNQELKAGLVTNQQYQNQLDKLNEQFGTNYKHVDNLGINYAKLAVRAVLVIPIWMALRSAFMGLINSIQQGVKFLIEFESAMAQIKIVGKGTEEDYRRLGDSVMVFSTVYGVAASEALKAAKLFAQQGLEMNEVIAMTRTAMIGSAVLGEDVGKVAEDLTAAIRAYHLEMSDSLVVVDKWMKVQKEFAVTSRDLAEGMKTSGATAAAFGISMDELNGHLTAIIETTRKSGSQAGNALQMIYTRIFTTGKKAIQEIGKVPVSLRETGEASFETTGQYRQASDVLDDLASNWNELTEAQKINLAVQVGSRRQATPFIALMENYSRALKAEVASLTSAGDALKSYNILQDTTVVKLTKMQNTWSQLARTLGDTSVFKTAIDGVTKLAEGLIYLANATDYLVLKEGQRLQKNIDERSINIARLESIQKLADLETRLAKMPKTESNIALAEEVKLNKQKLLDSNQELRNLDLKAEKEKNIRAEVERNFSREKTQLEQISKIQTPKNLLQRALGGTFDQLGIAGEAINIEKAKNELIKKYGSIEKARIEILNAIEKEVQARLAEKAVPGLLGSEIDETRVDQFTEKTDVQKKEQIAAIEHQADLMKNLGYTEQEITRYLINQYDITEDILTADEKKLKLAELRYQLENQITGAIKEQSDILKSSLEGGLKDFLLGEGTISDIGKKLGDTMRNQIAGAVAGGVTDKFFASTGMGNVFGVSINNLRSMISGKGSIVTSITGGFEEGSKLTYEAIVKGFRDSGVASTGSNVAGYTGTSGITTMGANVFTSGSSNGWWAQPVGGSRNVQGPLLKNQSRLNYNQGQTTRGQMAGMGMQSALIGYSQYQSAQSNGAGVGAAVGSGVLGAASAISVMGLMGTEAAIPLLGAAGPLGWGIAAALLVGSMLLGSMGGSSKSTDVTTTENKISSKIEVSNKNLELINRNLLALKSSIETYILPSSVYFSTKASIEDQYAINAVRGLV